MEDIIRNSAKKATELYDAQFIMFLEKNGISVDKRNVNKAIAEMKERGLRVIVDTQQVFNDTTYEFTLVEVVDSHKFKVKYSYEFEVDE